MAFGLTGAPSTYIKVSNLVLSGLTWNTVLAFRDDILVMRDSFQHSLTKEYESLGHMKLCENHDKLTNT